MVKDNLISNFGCGEQNISFSRTFFFFDFESIFRSFAVAQFHVTKKYTCGGDVDAMITPT